MSEKIEINSGKHSCSYFWGGDDRGRCVQITPHDGKLYVQLTMEDAAELCNVLRKFVVDEAQRRQGYLKESLKKYKIKEKSVFKEVAYLKLLQFVDASELAVGMVSKYCPRHPWRADETTLEAENEQANNG